MKPLGLVLGAALAACASGGGVKIDPLPADPTPEERLALWERYRPHGNVDEIVKICWNNGGCDRTEYRVIIFGDRRIVRESEDLTPLVARDSETLVHTRRAQRFAARANWWARAELVTVATGIVLGLVGNSNHNDSELTTGLGLILVGTVVGGYESRAEARNARNATSEAFAAYPRDLADRLHLCFNGIAVVPCEAPSEPPPPPPSAKPPTTTVPARTAAR